MKCRLELDDEDITAMVHGYFKSLGFAADTQSVKSIADTFKSMLPDGISVVVSPVAQTEASAEEPDAPESGAPKKQKKAAKAKSLTELLDPEDEHREMERLINENRRLTDV